MVTPVIMHSYVYAWIFTQKSLLFSHYESALNFKLTFCLGDREGLSEVKGDYYSRRSTLIKELAAIYPIDVGPKGSYYIVGVRLPNAESYAGENKSYFTVFYIVLLSSSYYDV